MTEKIVLQIAYQGTSYSGWQYQPNALSIQEVLETILKKNSRLSHFCNFFWTYRCWRACSGPDCSFPLPRPSTLHGSQTNPKDAQRPITS